MQTFEQFITENSVDQEYVYHITHKANLPSIIQKGLLPGQSGETCVTPHLRGVRHYQWCIGFDKGDTAVLRIKRRGLRINKFEDALEEIDSCEWQIPQIIKPENIEVLEQDKWMPIKSLIKESINHEISFTVSVKGRKQKVYPDYIDGEAWLGPDGIIYLGISHGTIAKQILLDQFNIPIGAIDKNSSEYRELFKRKFIRLVISQFQHTIFINYSTKYLQDIPRKAFSTLKDLAICQNCKLILDAVMSGKDKVIFDPTVNESKLPSFQDFLGQPILTQKTSLKPDFKIPSKDEFVTPAVIPAIRIKKTGQVFIGTDPIKFAEIKRKLRKFGKNSIESGVVRRSKFYVVNENIQLPVNDELALIKSEDDLIDEDIWDLLDIKNKNVVGEFTIGKEYRKQGKKNTIPWIRNSKILDPYRGKGYGRLAMKALVKHYGTLRSHLGGMTSGDAEKAWQAIGARRLTPAKRTPSNPGGRKFLDFSDYVLGKHQIKESAVIEPPKLNLSVYHYQDAHGEKHVHGTAGLGSWEAGEFRYRLENAGDILRELSKYPEDGWFSKDYIMEKINKLKHFLKNNPKEHSQHSHNLGDTERIKGLIKAYESQPTNTPEQALAKRLVIEIAQENFNSARVLLSQIENMVLRKKVALH